MQGATAAAGPRITQAVPPQQGVIDEHAQASYRQQERILVMASHVRDRLDTLLGVQPESSQGSEAPSAPKIMGSVFQALSAQRAIDDALDALAQQIERLGVL